MGLGYLGAKPPEGAYVIWSRIFTVYYFVHFLLVMPIIGLIETPKPLPKSISASVLPSGGGERRTAPPRPQRHAEREDMEPCDS